jgi:chemotaxis protein MotB
MKTLRINLILVPMALLMASSCVSTRKYTQAQSELKKYKDQASNLEQKNSMLQKSNDDLTKQLASVQKNNQGIMMQKDMELQKDQKALADLQNAVKMEETEVGNIRQELCSALKCFTPDEITVKELNGELYVSMYDKLLFPTGSTDVNKRGKEALKILSEVLRNNNMKIMVEGHTDSVPIHNDRFTDNWDLSVLRATNVIRVLTKEDKLDPNRISASGKGKFEPFYSNKTPEGRKLNRRTDIVLVPRLEELYSLINQGDNLKLTYTSK